MLLEKIKVNTFFKFMDSGHVYKKISEPVNEFCDVVMGDSIIKMHIKRECRQVGINSDIQELHNLSLAMQSALELINELNEELFLENGDTSIIEHKILLATIEYQSILLSINNKTIRYE